MILKELINDFEQGLNELEQLEIYSENIMEFTAVQAEQLIRYMVSHKLLVNFSELLYLLLKRLISLQSLSFSNLEQFSQFYLSLGKLTYIVELFDLYAQENKVDGNFYFNFAYYSKQNNQYKLARDYYLQAISLKAPYQDEIYLNLATLSIEGFADSEEANRFIDKALEVNPKSTSAYINLGNLKEGEGKVKEAIESFHQALLLEPDNAYALSRLLELSLEDKYKQLALAKLSFFQNEQDKLDILFALARVADKEKNYTEAQALGVKANLELKAMYPRYDESTISSVVDQLKQLTTELPKLQGNEKYPKVLFICGMYRSGSTLLEQILSAHEQIQSGGEMSFFPNMFGNNISNIPKMFQNPKQYELQLKDIREHHSKLINDRVGNFKGTYILDKRPGNILYIQIIKAIYPGAKVIITNREVKDMAISLWFQQLGPMFNYANDIENILHFYELIMELAEFYKSIYGDDIVIVDYEDIVADLESHISALLSLLQLEWQPAITEFYDNNNLVMTASMSQVRSPIYRGSIGRWHNYESLFHQPR